VPTFAWTARFRREFDALTPAQQQLFLLAVRKLVQDLRSGSLRSGLRVRPFRGRPNLFEITWAPDGRALFSYGASVHPGEVHIVWERIGGHEIFDNP
jgi:hypothetical protein